jgi:hypothetical protein
VRDDVRGGSPPAAELMARDTGLAGALIVFAMLEGVACGDPVAQSATAGSHVSEPSP